MKRIAGFIWSCRTSLFAGLMLSASMVMAQTGPAVLNLQGQGEAAVDSFNGEFDHQIEIEVPAYHGIEPRLALTYRSGGGNGFVGLGFSLTGLSQIDRISTGRGSPRYDSSDVWMLDGMEMLPCPSGTVSPGCVNGGTHATRIENYKRLKYVSASSGWIVTTKSGTQYHYAKAFALGGNTFRWLLSKVQDVHGNLVTYSYSEDVGNWMYPASISYNGTTITFYREARPDTLTAAAGSVMTTMSRRLKTIDIKVGTARARSYLLGYASSAATTRSLLTSVTQAGTDATIDAAGVVTGGLRLPATSFGWPTESAVWGASQSFGGLYGAGDAGIWLADMNGDARADYITKNFDQTIHWAIATKTGWAPLKSQGGLHGIGSKGRWFVDVNGDGRDDYVTKNNDTTIHWNLSQGDSWAPNQSQSGLQGVGQAGMWFVDVNGDGRQDYVTRNWDDTIHWNLSTGTGWAPNSSQAGLSSPGRMSDTVTLTMTSGSGSCGSFQSYTHYSETQWFVDLNGDGRVDSVGRYNDGTTRWHLSTGAGWAAAKSQADLAIGGTYVAVSAGSVSGYPCTYTGVAKTYRAWFVDLNGDGRVDYVTLLDDGSLRWHIGNGNGFGAAQTLTGMSRSGAIDFSDINGDGRADYVTNTGDGTIRWNLFTGAGWGATQIQANMHPIGDEGHWFVDVNGDGKADYLSKNSDGSIHQNLSAFVTPLVKSIANGFGGTTSITYVPSSTWENAVLPFNLWTVSSVTRNDGRGGAATTAYSYSMGLYDALERRFLGFRNIERKSPCNAGETVCPTEATSYYQLRAALSKPDQITRWAGVVGASAYELELFSYDIRDVLPYSATLQQHYRGMVNIAGTLRSAFVEYTYDAYGNVKSSFDYGENDLEGDEKTSTTTYYPNTTSYIVDRPAVIRTYEGIGTTGAELAKTVINYDDQYYTTPPVRGDVTLHRRWQDFSAAYLSTSYGYDAFGNVTSVTDPMGRVTRTDYEPTYNVYPIMMTNALLQSTSSTWDYVCGLPKVLTGLNGANDKTTNTYDELCRPERVDTPLGGFKTWAYCAIGSTTNPCGDASKQHVRVEGPPTSGTNNQWGLTYFDGLGRTWRTSARGPSAILQDTLYHLRGNIRSISAPYYTGATPSWTSFTYDGLERPLVTTHPDGKQTSLAYDLWTVTSTDELGRQRWADFDARGNKVADRYKHNGVEYKTTYIYDVLSRLTGITDARNNTWSYIYDTTGFLVSASDPDLGERSYLYYADGQLDTMFDARGNLTTYSYDDLGRKINEIVQNGMGGIEASWTYDEPRAGFFNIGRMTTMTDATGSEKVDYDLAGRPAKRIKNIDGTNYSYTQGYDAAGRLKWTTYPDGDTVGTVSATLGYDAAGRPYSIPGVVNSATYTAQGDLDTLTNANGTITTLGYDARHRLTDIDTLKGTTILQNLVHTRDDGGKITKITSPFHSEGWTNFGYDDLDRLETATNTTSALNSQSWDYDQVGNMTYNSLLGSYAYPTQGASSVRPHAVKSSTLNGVVTNYLYDANGNMTKKGATTYTWDVANRLASVGTMTFAYDGNGARVKKIAGTGTSYYPSPDYRVKNGQITKHISFAGRQVAKRQGTATSRVTHWLHTNHLGSTQVITDATGAHLQRLTQRPYGDRFRATSSVEEETDFLGERLDTEIGLIYQRSRYYDPELGRYTAADTWNPANPSVGVNRYAYAGNDPVNRYDDGNQAATVGKKATTMFDDMAKLKQGVDAINDPSGFVTNLIIGSQPLLRGADLAAGITKGVTGYDLRKTLGQNADYEEEINRIAGQLGADPNQSFEENERAVQERFPDLRRPPVAQQPPNWWKSDFLKWVRGDLSAGPDDPVGGSRNDPGNRSYIPYTPPSASIPTPQVQAEIDRLRGSGISSSSTSYDQSGTSTWTNSDGTTRTTPTSDGEG